MLEIVPDHPYQQKTICCMPWFWIGQQFILCSLSAFYKTSTDKATSNQNKQCAASSLKYV